MNISKEDWIEFRSNATKYLEQHSQYATRKAVQFAIDKQTPQTPNIWVDGYSDGELVYDMYDCPNCGKHYELDYEQYDYCSNCGQKLDWTVLEGEDVDERS